MKFWLILTTSLFLLSYACNAKENGCRTLRVAIIDTGLDVNDPRFSNRLCETGSKNFVSTETMNDLMGHGTHVAGLIKKNAKDANYCLLIFKFYENDAQGSLTINRMTAAIQEAVKQHADVINISAGGPQFSEDEYLLIKNNPQIAFVVAAGNDGRNVDIPGNEYYPASYWLKNEFVVANMDDNRNRAVTSNWGKKVKWQYGENVLSTLPCAFVNGEVICEGRMSGTSMATAIYSGKLVDSISKSCDSR